MTITGRDLIAWGVIPGPGFKELLSTAQGLQMTGSSPEEVRLALKSYIPPPPAPTIPMRAKGGGPAYYLNLDWADDDETGVGLEHENALACTRHMDELMRVPTVVGGAIMPDACPTAGGLGTIPVGGVVVTEGAIHPGFHSADICCSMAFTKMRGINPKEVLDVGMRITHFGPGGRETVWTPSGTLMHSFRRNKFLENLQTCAVSHFGTQGDGNHFFYVGILKSTGDTVLVTHHGSRGPGARLYKAGMKIANAHRKVLSPETPAHNAWIPSESEDGRAYWDALQIIRQWTKESHFAIHDRVLAAIGAPVFDRFWNEHNFVFRRDDGLFYHAKGATPAYRNFAMDSNGLTLIPLNMAAPILIAKGLDAPHAKGFAPHGAGRNQSRTSYARGLAGRPLAEVVAEQTRGIDARFYNGVPDISELPGAYKNATQMIASIESFGLAEIVDTIEPYGCIMAGAYERGKPKIDMSDIPEVPKEFFDTAKLVEPNE